MINKQILHGNRKEMFKTPVTNEKLQMDIKINFYKKRNKNFTAFYKQFFSR